MVETPRHQSKNHAEKEKYLALAGGDHKLAELLMDNAWLKDFQAVRPIDGEFTESIEKREALINQRRLELEQDPPTES